MTTRSSRRDWIWRVALLVAAVAGAGLVVAGFRAPLYDTDTVSSSGEVTHGSASLVDVNGSGVVVVLLLPLLVTGLVAGALLLRRHRGALAVAWGLTSLLAVFTLLSMLTIGPFVVPVTAALLVACGAASRTEPEHGPAPATPA